MPCAASQRRQISPCGLDQLRAAGFFDASLSEPCDPVAQGARTPAVMGDGDDGAACARMQMVQCMEQRPKPLAVLPHGRLVQQQQLRLRGSHGGNGHPALLSLGKGVGMPLR